jgi:hypothetical protein
MPELPEKGIAQNTITENHPDIQSKTLCYQENNIQAYRSIFVAFNMVTL